MAQVEITAAELDTFRRIYADVAGEEVEIAEGVYAIEESFKGRLVVVAQLGNKTLAAGPGIKR
jgi:hypothetical protein